MARRRRARQLLESIKKLRKPQPLERFVAVGDGERLLQTLVNTENIERAVVDQRENQGEPEQRCDQVEAGDVDDQAISVQQRQQNAFEVDETRRIL